MKDITYTTVYAYVSSIISLYVHVYTGFRHTVCKLLEIILMILIEKILCAVKKSSINEIDSFAYSKETPVNMNEDGEIEQ